MTDIILGVGVGVFTIFAVAQIVYLLSLIKAVHGMTSFFKNIEGNLNASLVEARATLENLKQITDDARAVTGDVRQISAAVTGLQKDITSLATYAKESLSSAVDANVAGLKAGIKAGVVTLVKNLHQERSDGHDGEH